MGYYTYHSLTIEPDDDDLLRQIITSESEESEIRYALEDDGRTSQSTKWYCHDNDMRKLSQKWPNVTFHLHGEGEENDDIWTATYRDGLCHHRRAQITIEDFDPQKLE